MAKMLKQDIQSPKFQHAYESRLIADLICDMQFLMMLSASERTGSDIE